MKHSGFCTIVTIQSGGIFPEPVRDVFAEQHGQCVLLAGHISGRRQMHASIVNVVSIPPRVQSTTS